jgi:hypothetical protein
VLEESYTNEPHDSVTRKGKSSQGNVKFALKRLRLSQTPSSSLVSECLHRLANENAQLYLLNGTRKRHD